MDQSLLVNYKFNKWPEKLDEGNCDVMKLKEERESGRMRNEIR